MRQPSRTVGPVAAPLPHRPARDVTARDLLAGVVRGRRGYRAHQVLHDPAAHRQLAVHGYTVTEPVLTGGEIEALVEACHDWLALSPHPADGRFHSSYEPEPTDAGVVARRSVTERLLPALRRQVRDEAFLRPSVFQCKPPGPISGVRCHQDSFLLDEQRAFGLFAWVALTPVRVRDGAMVVLPGSHRYATWTRASTSVDPFEDLHRTIERHGRALELEPGQVIWFDQAAIHGSLPNLGDALRLGVSAVAQPKACRATFPRARDSHERGIADVFWLPLSAAAASRPPTLDDARRVGTVGLDRMAFTPDDLDRACRLHARLHPGAPGVPVPAGTSCRP